MTPILSPSLTYTISILCRFLSNAFLRQSDSTLLTLMIWQCILRGKPFSSRRPSVYISGWVTGPCQLQRSPGSVRCLLSDNSKVFQRFPLHGLIGRRTAKKKMRQLRSRPLFGVIFSGNCHEVTLKVGP